MTNRRHAAIMFTDIVGYTSLMGSDEDRAFEVLAKNREIHNQLVEKYKGTLIKEMGDGMLISFNLASDAVRCAIEIQKTSKEQDIPLKIGIHEGEMVFEGNDVLGDGVNIASRIQDDTQEGCIMISGSVYKDIKNKSDIKTKFIKEKAFKNVDEPVKVYQVLCEGETKEDKSGQDQDQKKSGSRIMYYIVGGLVVVIAAILIWQFIPNKEAGKPTPEETVVEMDRSIAVLPFKNLSPEEENQYFCDGIMEGILNHLSKIKDLRVVSRTSVEKYRDGSIQSPQIGEELNVTYLVEASVFKLDDKIRVTAQLIESAKDEHIWSGEYDRDLKDVFEVMSDISQQVASEVKVVIAPEVKERIESIPTKNLDAYNYYLLGLHNSNQLTTDGFLSSIEYYEKALQLDPKFAHAYVGVALGYHNLVRYSFIRQEEGYPKAKEAILNALEIDPSLGDAHAALGLIMAVIDWDIQGAEPEFKKAIKLSPGNAEVYSSYAQYLRWLGRYDESISYAKRALDLDPLTPMTNVWLANFYTYAGQYFNSAKQLEKTIHLDTTFVIAHNWAAVNATLMGMNDKAITHAEKIEAYPSFDKSTILISHIGWVYAKLGYNDIGRKYLDLLHDLSNEYFVDPVYYALIHIGLEEKEATFTWLEKAVEIHSGQVIYLNGYADIFFQDISSDPRYDDLLKKIGFRQ